MDRRRCGYRPFGSAAGRLGPASWPWVVPYYPNAYADGIDYPEGQGEVARIPWEDGLIVVVRVDQPGITYFSTISLFTFDDGISGGFVLGGPGEGFNGCSWSAYNEAGYTMVVVADPSWTVTRFGEEVELVEAGEVAVGIVSGNWHSRLDITSPAAGLACD